MSKELEALDQISDAIEKNNQKHAAEMQKMKQQLEEMQEDVAAGRNSGGRSRGKSLGQQVIDQIQEKKLDLTQMSKGQHQQFVLKTPATMTTANVDAVGSNSIPFSLSDPEFGLARVQRRQPYLMELGNVSPINSMYAQWAEQENPDGSPAPTAEGSDKPMIDWDWVEKSQKVEKIPAFVKTSKEMLSDLPGLRNTIDSELTEVVMLKADDQLLDGDGNTPNLKGLLQFATSYSAPSGMTGIDNYFDKLRAGIAQVGENKFNPSAIVLHPTDLAQMDITKSDDDGHYLSPPFVSANGLISRIPIVTNLGMTQGSFLIGDFSKFIIRIREGLTIDIGYEMDDFTKNLITILAEIRLVCYVKGVHTGAFVVGDFDAS